MYVMYHSGYRLQNMSPPVKTTCVVTFFLLCLQSTVTIHWKVVSQPMGPVAQLTVTIQKLHPQLQLAYAPTFAGYMEAEECFNVHAHSLAARE